jgi:hypothetical protein
MKNEVKKEIIDELEDFLWRKFLEVIIMLEVIFLLVVMIYLSVVPRRSSTDCFIIIGVCFVILLLWAYLGILVYRGVPFLSCFVSKSYKLRKMKTFAEAKKETVQKALENLPIEKREELQGLEAERQELEECITDLDDVYFQKE